MDPPAVQYVTTSDGYNIAYTVCGEGPTLVEMPASFSHAQLWWTIPGEGRRLGALASRFRLVRYDHRGQGMSTRKLDGTPTAADYGKDLEAVIERVAELGPVILVGQTVFSLVAAMFAAHRPERIRALILRSPFLERRGAMAFSAEMAVQDWGYFVATAAQNGQPAEDNVLVRSVFRQCFSSDAFLQFHRATNTFSVAHFPSGLKVPTLVLATKDDVSPIPQEEAAKQAAALIPDARLVIFDAPGGGFNLEPDGTAPAMMAIERFLSDLPAGIVKAAPEGVGFALSARELEVLRLIAAGRSNPQIADELVISLNTVQRHVSNILSKTGLANRTEAAVYARDRGLG